MLAIYERNSGSGYLSDEYPESQIFSLCIPAVIDLIQQDIFGSTSGIKEVDGVKKRLIKESSGGKIFNTLEIVAGKIIFKPSLALSATDEPNKNVRGVASAAHTLVPLIPKRLQEPDIHTSTIGKVKKCLNIIVIGLSHNTNVEARELFPFVYMSVSNFFSGSKPIESNKTRKNLMTMKLRKSPI